MSKMKKTCHLQQYKCDFKPPYIWRSLVIFTNNCPALRITSILEVCNPCYLLEPIYGHLN